MNDTYTVQLIEDRPDDTLSYETSARCAVYLCVRGPEHHTVVLKLQEVYDYGYLRYPTVELGLIAKMECFTAGMTRDAASDCVALFKKMRIRISSWL